MKDITLKSRLGRFYVPCNLYKSRGNAFKVYYALYERENDKKRWGNGEMELTTRNGSVVLNGRAVSSIVSALKNGKDNWSSKGKMVKLRVKYGKMIIDAGDISISLGKRQIKSVESVLKKAGVLE